MYYLVMVMLLLWLLESEVMNVEEDEYIENPRRLVNESIESKMHLILRNHEWHHTG